jgi:uncharacterized protein YecT (DUF1311 family)
MQLFIQGSIFPMRFVMRKKIPSIAFSIFLISLTGCGVGEDGRATRLQQGSAAVVSLPSIAAISPAAQFFADKIDAGISVRDEYRNCVRAAAENSMLVQACIVSEFEFQDARLNANYQEIGSSLKGWRLEEVGVAKRQWLKRRDSECVWHEKKQGQAPAIAVNEFWMRMTAQRADELKKIVSPKISSSQSGSLMPAISANAVLDANGRLNLRLGDIAIELRALKCQAVNSALSFCRGGIELNLKQVGAKGPGISVKPSSIYLEKNSTAYRGALDNSGNAADRTIIISDIDSDGYEDLALWSAMRGSYGGGSYDVYLFDGRKKIFALNRDLSNLTVGRSGMFSVIDGRIIARSKSGCCIHSSRIYTIEHGKSKLVEEVVEEASGDGSVMKKTVKRMINGVFVEVH